ncbi:MAG: bacillithiol biosynthesis deacetylase BshB1 [Bacteroidetes bacterium]|jgi:bacillithiol biosynthesis deacetylase BshB1|nr:bacillithiol biosynthesis deacetylase BshB1 [Bacteroidota bacterium]
MDKALKLDALAIVAHPDDAELCMAGTLLKMTDAGKQVGIVDLTRGELGTRGSAELRDEEAARASEQLGLATRVNLDLGDGFFEETEETLRAIISQIRHLRPEVVFSNAPSDRHPDHGRGHSLVHRACFLSGLPKIETQWQQQPQAAWRPRQVFSGIQDHYHTPSFVVDITDYFARKLDVIRCYSSQFYNPESNEPETPISSLSFWKQLEGRALEYGRMMGVTYAEGFISTQPIGVESPLQLL